MSKSKFILKEWKTVIKGIKVDEKGRLLIDHYHTFSLTTGDSGSHTHFLDTDAVDCGSGATHSHGLNTASGGSTHHHTVSGNTDSVTAYSLNHTHNISVNTSTDTLPSHSHDAPAGGVYENKCANCADTHGHSMSGTTGITSLDHYHTLSGATGTGEGTIENHRHSIDLTTSTVYHNHSVGTLALSSNTCELGYSHNHGISATTVDDEGHSHSVSGYTDYAAGEIVSKELKALYDIFIRKELKAIYDIFFGKQLKAIYDIFFGKQLKAIYDIFQSKVLKAIYTIIFWIEDTFSEESWQEEEKPTDSWTEDSYPDEPWSEE